MNRNTMRIGGVAVLAALAFGLGGTAAQASTAPAAPAITATTQEQQQAAQSLATVLLNSPIEYSAADRAELQKIANGEKVAAGRFDGLIRLLKKVPGFARAVGGSFGAFQAWFDALPWYYKTGLEAAGVAGDLYSIWQAFH
ncbi:MULTISPECIES: hypothetical protein [Streptomyces]|uniref:hypothetical protein n=1 Tax=Streptomyces TaxID=1883 RepID=UPI0003177C48|nr:MULTISPECIES: hypothetical protein [Streptomyces]WBY25058.1 hypothetical protein PET44_35575 [Streptomyces goshikiensis]